MTASQEAGRAINRALAPLGVRLHRTRTAPSEDLDQADAPPPVWGFDSHPALKHQTLLPQATYAPWATDPAFQAAWTKLGSSSLLDNMRAYELWALALQARNVPGDVLEVGTWRGGSIALMGAAMQGTQKAIYAADTFSGVVKAGAEDTYYRGGEHSDACRDDVEAAFAAVEVSTGVILEGVFPDETGSAVAGALSMVHIDVDVYRSARDITEFALPRLSRGGFIVFDDYGFYGCEGVTQYGNELLVHPEIAWLYDLNGHLVGVRTSEDSH
jgi:O-methyltransferase